MKSKPLFLLLSALMLGACSLAEDVTPPPALATAQAAPVGQMPISPSREPEAQVPALLSPAEAAPNLSNGAAIFAESCEPCHGPAGLGDGSMSANLQVPVPAIGDLALASAVRPLDWYGVVTEGRMENFMPPFTSLSDSQRWDVVAYALSLSYPPETRERGSELFAETCATCHGEDGAGADLGPSLITAEGFAERSLTGMVDVIREGRGEMPAYADALAEADLVLLAAYTQSLGAFYGETAEAPGSGEAPDPARETGTIRGVVTNGTAGGSLPEGLDITIVALEGDTPAFEEIRPVADDGTFAIENLTIVPGRIYGALVEYQDVVYYSVGGHLLEDAPELDLPVTIYETTPDESSLVIDRLHIIFDFSIEGLVEISEFVLISSTGDRTVVQPGGQNAIPLSLPEGFSNLRFDTTAASDFYTPMADGFVIHEPVRPGEPLEVVFSFTLPYRRALDFNQPLDLPVQAVVLLTESDAPDIEGERVQDLGTREMSGLSLRSYAMEGLGAGDRVDLRLRGAHPMGQPEVSASNLAIGLGVFGVVLVGVGFVLWTWQRRTTEERVEQPVAAQSRSDLLLAIARLDDAFEAGDMDQETYEGQRAALKSQILERLPKND